MKSSLSRLLLFTKQINNNNKLNNTKINIVIKKKFNFY